MTKKKKVFLSLEIKRSEERKKEQERYSSMLEKAMQSQLPEEAIKRALDKILSH